MPRSQEEKKVRVEEIRRWLTSGEMTNSDAICIARLAEEAETFSAEDVKELAQQAENLELGIVVTKNIDRWVDQNGEA